MKKILTLTVLVAIFFNTQRILQKNIFALLKAC